MPSAKGRVAKMTPEHREKEALMYEQMIVALLHTIHQRVWEKENHPLRRSTDAPHLSR